MTTTGNTTTAVGDWDRAAILLLGAAGCALSYDALQQMAVAIHIRGLLTYLYPLVIDGFIGYGVRALILTRTAPWRARLYVWALFGTATAASIWANALHAIRLNQLHHAETAGLRLGDVTVGVLSTLAPLALAGAVHLYILITRHQPARTEVAHGPVRTDHPACADQQTARADRSADHRRAAAGPESTVRTSPHNDHSAGQASGPVRSLQTTAVDRSAETVRALSGPWTETLDGPLAEASASHEAFAADRDQALPHPQEPMAPGPLSRTAAADRSATGSVRMSGPRTAETTSSGPSAQIADRSAADQRTAPSETDEKVRTGPQEGADQRTGPQNQSAPLDATADQRTADAADRQSADRCATGGDGEEQDIEELLPIARAAVTLHGRINRTVVRSGLREHQIQVSNQRLGLILQRLRDEAALAA
ncbi:DUF2637 domain-containing protein [Streptomyces sp. UNOC14_S4]|uniref:DUF2637 domain-containing protein n=1 Tax=Streptomyces sp. UNOC14_S4 TaxID=2872340 RepID=UPI001E44626A|nr:DUF2637 domain-containing protein [Streptomyces sp. UNOC14_S4]